MSRRRGRELKKNKLHVEIKQPSECFFYSQSPLRIRSMPLELKNANLSSDACVSEMSRLRLSIRSEMRSGSGKNISTNRAVHAPVGIHDLSHAKVRRDRHQRNRFMLAQVMHGHEETPQLPERVTHGPVEAGVLRHLELRVGPEFGQLVGKSKAVLGPLLLRFEHGVSRTLQDGPVQLVLSMENEFEIACTLARAPVVDVAAGSSNESPGRCWGSRISTVRASF